MVLALQRADPTTRLEAGAFNKPPEDRSPPYLSECSDAFIQTADVKFIVGLESYPAHSQLLCCRSDVIHRMLEDCSHCSVEEPLVIGEALSQYGATATQTFLKHVYQHHPVSSHEEAQQLLSMAHLLDAPSLMKKAVSYMEDTKHLLQASCEPAGAIYWLLLADRFDLTNFRQQCINFTVQHFHVLQRDGRVEELCTATCLALLRALQDKIDKHEAICPCVNQNSNSALPRFVQESVSQHTPATNLYRGFGAAPIQTSTGPFGLHNCVTFGAGSGPQRDIPFGHAFGAQSGPHSTPAFGDMSTPAFGAGGSGPQSTPAFGFGTGSGFQSTLQSTPAFGNIRNDSEAGLGPQSTPALGDIRNGFGAGSGPQSTPAFGDIRPQSSTFGARM